MNRAARDPPREQSITLGARRRYRAAGERRIRRRIDKKTLEGGKLARQFVRSRHIGVGEHAVRDRVDAGCGGTATDRLAVLAGRGAKVPFAMLTAPIAVAKSPFAVLNWPIAVVVEPFAVLFWPIAVAKAPFAVLAWPVAVALAPFAVLFWPVAVAKSPFAVLVWPVAVALAPCALAPGPHASPLTPFAAAPPLLWGSLPVGLVPQMACAAAWVGAPTSAAADRPVASAKPRSVPLTIALLASRPARRLAARAPKAKSC